MKVTLKKPDGSSVEVEHTEVQALLDEGYTLGQDKGKVDVLSPIATALGLQAADLTPEKLAELKVQAAAGKTFRQSLEKRLEQAHARLSADAEKAEKAYQRSLRIFAHASAEDLEEEVVMLEARVEALGLPDGQQSKTPVEEGEQKKEFIDLDAV